MCLHQFCSKEVRQRSWTTPAVTLPAYRCRQYYVQCSLLGGICRTIGLGSCQYPHLRLVDIAIDCVIVVVLMLCMVVGVAVTVACATVAVGVVIAAVLVMFVVVVVVVVILVVVIVLIDDSVPSPSVSSSLR